MPLPATELPGIRPAHGISFNTALRTWATIGLQSFGGPAGQIAVMHRIVVDEKRWISDSRFLLALNYCTLLPGPEAQQLATYIGWLLHGTRGGLAAGLLFIAPGFVAMLLLCVVYVTFGHLPLIDGIFLGLKAAVLALVVAAVIRVGQRALRSTVARITALCAFTGIFVFAAPFPLIVLGAGIFGFLWTRAGRTDFAGAANHGPATAANAALIADAHLTQVQPTARRALYLLAIWLPVWFLPIAVAALYLGPTHVAVTSALFFAKMAVVTFGGAYAVLAYVAQQAVAHYNWLTPGQMLDGLGLAETTPGPLVLVVQFVGFLAGQHAPGVQPPFASALLCASLAVWVTFAPCFLWIFLGAPYVEKLRQQPPLAGALAAITAAVVGVIMNLALWFALHALFTRAHPLVPGTALALPVLSSVQWPALTLALVALTLTFALRWPALRMLATLAALGAAWVVFS